MVRVTVSGVRNPAARRLGEIVERDCAALECGNLGAPSPQKSIHVLAFQAAVRGEESPSQKGNAVGNRVHRTFARVHDEAQ